MGEGCWSVKLHRWKANSMISHSSIHRVYSMQVQAVKDIMDNFLLHLASKFCRSHIIIAM